MTSDIYMKVALMISMGVCAREHIGFELQTEYFRSTVQICLDHRHGLEIVLKAAKIKFGIMGQRLILIHFVGIVGSVH